MIKSVGAHVLLVGPCFPAGNELFLTSETFLKGTVRASQSRVIPLALDRICRKQPKSKVNPCAFYGKIPAGFSKPSFGFLGYSPKHQVLQIGDGFEGQDNTSEILGCRWDSPGPYLNKELEGSPAWSTKKEVK